MRAKPYVSGIALRRTHRIPFAKDAFLKTELTFNFFFPLLSFIYYSVYKFYFFYDILLIAFFLNVLLLLSCAVGSRTLCKRSFLFIAKAFSEPLAQPGVFKYNKSRQSRDETAFLCFDYTIFSCFLIPNNILNIPRRALGLRTTTIFTIRAPFNKICKGSDRQES